MISRKLKEATHNHPQESPGRVVAENHSITLPGLSLPKGGGAIRGIGEKFAANPTTGTSSLSVPISITPARSAFSPQLSLSYDSGNGNGLFGLGWSLSVPSITRKTDKGLPRYQDADDSDVFMLTGAEDLVPVMSETDGRWERRSFDSPLSEPGYTIERYRPRIEGLFARIEKWTDKTSGAVHWRSIDRQNTTTIYGRRTDARVADPADLSRVFSWLASESYDDKGNAILYLYKAEDDSDVDRSQPYEKNRLSGRGFAQKYLKHIKYGNRSPRNPVEDLTSRTDWLFEVVFDYGEHDDANPEPREIRRWRLRHDPFSSYRAGFEVRTYRLCRRVLMFHHFAGELGSADYLTRSTDLSYRESGVASFVTAITQSGYVRKADGSYLKKSLPSLELAYSESKVDETIRSVDTGSLENLPAGLEGRQYQWVDLYSDGVSGILTEQANAWFYKRNLSPVNVEPENGLERSFARFAPAEPIDLKPSLSDINNQRQRFLDLNGTGQLDLAQFEDPLPGYYERTQEGDWENFFPFASIPNLAWNDPQLKFIDLTGDGRPDVLISEDEVFVWHQSLGDQGFASSRTVLKVRDEDRGPALVFADATESIHLADISGDGLTDLVRIRNGEVCYWPNLGYGRFGAKVLMKNPPWFDQPDLFKQQQIRLADIDGSGTVDIIYLGREKITFWINESGNGWSSPHELSQFPATDWSSSVLVFDLLGNGTACIVWSSPLAADAHRPMRYIDLTSGTKPHLLASVKNNMGAETKIQYAPSTKFYLRDREQGEPWITKLPFPVHVAERIETFDHLSKTKQVTLYKYHHGYFDGPEREFRGFGMVEQWDTESFSRFSGAGLFTETPASAGEEFHLPPVHTKTWFHCGAFQKMARISRQFESEYYQSDRAAILLPDTDLPSGLTPIEEREACRALKGQILRQEIYSEDNSARSGDPFSVTEHSYQLRRIQPRAGNRHAIFYAHESEAISYHYERNSIDPRISHQMSLELDSFGNVTKSAAIGYSRRVVDSSLPVHAQQVQAQTLITYTESDFTNSIDTDGAYRTPLPAEVRTYELTNVSHSSTSSYYTPADLLHAAEAASEIQYEEHSTAGLMQKRLIERVRTHYLKDDLSAPLPLRRVESLALPHQNYRQAFTPGLRSVFRSRIADADLTALLTGEGGYRDLDGDGALWIPSDEILFSPVPRDPARFRSDVAFARIHFYLPHASRDAFGSISRITYDSYDLLVTQTEDPLGNLVAARNDYRVMQPAMMTDPNGNRTAVSFDALGLVVGTAVMGKVGETDPAKMGDTLADFRPDLDDETIVSFFNDPLAHSRRLLAGATTRVLYDLDRFRRDNQPVVAATISRETHHSEETAANSTKLQHGFVYSDGSGRELLNKAQAEPGIVVFRQSDGSVRNVDTSPQLRWVGTGRIVFDNKGNPVKKYEPFFDTHHRFTEERELVELGVTSILRYDALGRLVRTDLPNGTFSKVEFDPWKQITYDENDTVRESVWYRERGSPDPAGREPSGPEERAAWLAAKHADTTGVVHLDSLGRTFMTVADNGRGADGSPQRFETRIELDIEGNQRSVTDARGNRVMEYVYDMLGTKIQQRSMDAGERWMLTDVAGKPIRSWDSRDHLVRHEYDALRRPTRLAVRTGAAEERLVEQIIYGESLPEAEARTRNLRGKVVQHFDGARVVANDRYDFKGNLVSSSRRLVQNYRDEVDWSQSPAPTLERESFTTSATYDALNRPVSSTTPDGSISRPNYNEAGLLEQINVNLRGATVATNFVSNVDYDAKGQRQVIEYRIVAGSGASAVMRTRYEYDPLTFRLIHLTTVRTSDGALLQDLRYSYDPVGNITTISDAAQQTIYFRNSIVEPSNEYEYDAIYRLTSARGREHLGQNGSGRLNPPRQPDHDDSFHTNLLHPGDGNAMSNYRERYEYDSVGNILRLVHEAGAAGSWTRRYSYDGENNRLLSTSLPGDADDGPFSGRYTYDAHGSMTSMPHLRQMEWDFKDQLHLVRRQVVTEGVAGEKVYYVYDARGERVRKVIERPNGSIRQERIYLGGYELYREHDVDRITLERETLHIMDDQHRIALVETKTVDTAAPPFAPASLIRYQLGNHLGSASLELDGAGEIISYEEYFPYGSTSYQAVRGGVEVSAKRYRFTGKERDEETGLNYHSARYYATWLGRWTASDPIGPNGGINLYIYASDNPINRYDPSGHVDIIPPNRVYNPYSDHPIFDQSLRRTQQGFQVPGYLRYEATNTSGGNLTLRSTLLSAENAAIASEVPVHAVHTGADVISQFHPSSGTFLGTGDTNTEIYVRPPLRGQGIANAFRSGAFERFRQITGRAPIRFRLHVTNVETVRDLRGGTPFFQTLIGRNTNAAARSVGVRITSHTAPVATGMGGYIIEGTFGTIPPPPRPAGGGGGGIPSGPPTIGGGSVTTTTTVAQSTLQWMRQNPRATVTTIAGGLAAQFIPGWAELQLARSTIGVGNAARLAVSQTARAAVQAAPTVAMTAAAAFAVYWAYTDINRSLAGQPTMTDEAVQTWGHYGFLGTLRQFGRELRDAPSVLGLTR